MAVCPANKFIKLKWQSKICAGVPLALRPYSICPANMYTRILSHNSKSVIKNGGEGGVDIVRDDIQAPLGTIS